MHGIYRLGYLLLIFFSLSFLPKILLAQHVSYSECYKFVQAYQDDSLKMYLEANKDNLSSNDSIIYHLFLGKYHRFTNNEKLCIENLYKGFGLIDYTVNDSLKAFYLDELSIILRDQSNSEKMAKSLSYVNESIKIKSENLDTSGLAKSYLIKGNYYYHSDSLQSNLDSAAHCYSLSLDLISENDLEMKIMLNKNLSFIQATKGNTDSSIEYLYNSIEYQNQQNDVYGKYSTLMGIAYLLGEVERFDEAKIILDTILKPIQDLEFFDLEAQHAANMSDLFVGLGNYKEAYSWEKKVSSVHHNLMDEELNEAMVKYNTQATELQRDKAIQKQLETEIELNNRKFWLSFFGGLSLLLGIISYSIIRMQSLRRLAIQNELQATKTQAALDATKAEMEGEQKQRQVIASMLHDQVASLLTAANMHLTVAAKKMDEKGKEPIQKTKGILTDVNTHVRNLSHQLVSPALMKFGLEPALDSLTDKLDTSEMRINFKSTFGKERLENSKEIFVYRSCAELIQNVLKHSNGDRADVLLSKKDGKLSLEVRDNGTHTVINENPKLGLGLTHIKSRAEALGGDFSISIKEDETIASLSIDLNEYLHAPF